ncbi:MAG TPA: transcriptional regulator [Pedococcus sp.]|nr:transcriptional regulator [Pedococcus sp.]
MTPLVRDRQVSAIAALDDPVRSALLELVSRSDSPMSRDAAAEAAGVTRRVAAGHLDRLVAEGLLAVTFRRLTGRTGPGAGRPSKLYQRTATEIAVTVPPRHYDLVADLLAGAVEESDRTGAPARQTLARTAREAGRRLGADERSLDAVLESGGFEPKADEVGGVVLGNCPFHRLAQRHTQLVCGLNLELLRGAAEGSGEEPARAILDPAPGRCCVRFAPETG